ncbi:MAG: transposase [Bacillota bacterium]|nr:transposase [Bacillota bacterium]
MLNLVPLPDKRITYKKGRGDTRYVYYTLRAYRNERGQPTSDEMSIGKLDNETGMLIPNRNYFELFPDQAPPTAVLSLGLLAVFSDIAQRVGLTETLSAVFSEEHTRTILSLASYMLAEGNVMMGYPDWYDAHVKKDLVALSSQEISRFFAQITEHERSAFFEMWSRKYLNNDYIVYDVTSISTYSEQDGRAERGYNRDGEKLAQINLGLHYGQNSRMPLLYRVYSGSIVDKSYFPAMLAHCQVLRLENVRFVMDQGMLTEDNIKLVVEEGYSALCSLSAHLKLYKSLLSQVIQTPFSSREYLSSLELYGRSIDADYFGIPIKVHFYYDQEKAAVEEKSLYADIERKREELGLLQKQKKLKPSQSKYFRVEAMGQRELDFELDYEKIDALKTKLGYFALFSTDLNISAEEALTLYRNKDVVEKAFDQLKNGLDYRRMRTHHVQSTEGKLFVAFVSLIVRCTMLQLIKADPEIKKTTLKQAVGQLERIQELHGRNKAQLLTLTKKQKQILKALKVELG